ncbi:MAG TPA: pitrilysin family protein [Terriglobales bacterium]|nr:pitrilysin family protein [Terriglobales bacterium]
MRNRPAAGPLVLACGLAAALALGPPARTWAQERLRRTPPLPDPFRELKLPAIESFSLPNGLTIAAARRPGYPIVTVQLVVLAGEADSPADLPFVATLTARMVGRRTREFSADEMAAMLDAVGGGFSVSVSMDYTVLTFHVPAEFMDRALEILRAMVLQPEFSDLEAATAKRILSYELRDLEKNPEFIGRRQLLRLLFRGHPYGSGAVSWDVIRRITAKDIETFYGLFFRPNNAVLVVSGDAVPFASDRRLTLPFAPWTRRDIIRAPLVPPPANAAEKVCLVDHPAAEDFVIFAGNLAPAPASPDYYPFLVLNQVLGGTMASRLFMNLRESKGYAYEAFSEAEFFKSCGAFWAKARVTPQTIGASVQEIEREFRNLAAERIVPDELEVAKSFLIGNLPLKYKSLEGYAERLSQAVAFGLTQTDWARASDSLMLVNADRVLEAARRCLTPVPVIVIVGDRRRALPALGAFEAVDIYDNTGAFLMTLRKGEVR